MSAPATFRVEVRLRPANKLPAMTVLPSQFLERKRASQAPVVILSCGFAESREYSINHFVEHKRARGGAAT
jgi:hypothetical protein